MKHVFIINSQITEKKKTALRRQISACLQAEPFIIAETRHEHHALELAKTHTQAGAPVRLYACGGDGTLHQIVNGIAAFAHTELAILPLGTGNDFIKTLAPLTKQDFLTLSAYRQPQRLRCDLLQVNERLAINTASIGLDVKIAKNVDSFKQLSFLGSALPYYMGLLVSMFHPLTTHCRLLLDDTPYEDDYTFLVCGNGRYYGGGYCPVPNALLNDRKMDICLIRKVSRRKILALSHAYKKGTHTARTDLVHTATASSLRLLSPKQQISVNVDGEIMLCDDLHIRMADEQLTLVLPKQE